MVESESYYFNEDSAEDYEEELSHWTAADWLASGIETSPDFDQFYDHDLFTLTSLASSNSTDSHESKFSSSLVYSLIDLTDNCISPSLSQLINQLIPILIFCCAFRVLSLSKLFSSRQLHLLQIISSLVILGYFFHFQAIYLLTYAVMGFFAFQVCLSKCPSYLTGIISCFSIIYVVACEFILVEQDKWHAIRGVQMCLMMKLISLSFDYPMLNCNCPSKNEENFSRPTAVELFSYLLSIHNTIFGPWINYRNYIRYYDRENFLAKIDFFELVRWASYLFRVALCLTISTCFTDWILRTQILSMDDQELTSNGWRTAYIQALSYRFSHYCVCFIGELTGQMSGLKFDVDEYKNYFTGHQQTKMHIETENKFGPSIETDGGSMNHDSSIIKRKQQTKKLTSKKQETDNSIEISNGAENDSTNIVVNRHNAKKNPTSQNGSTIKYKGFLRSNSQNVSSSLSTNKSAIHSDPVSHSSSIVKLSHIEVPRSLVDVVINWNIPMHYWLKIYVYVPIKRRYGHFPSVMITYLASALLHGFNFQLSIVLFSIGIFAYVEYGFRRKLARIIDACVGARRCSSDSACEEHRYTYWHPLTMMINLFLCLLSLWHLTYLGQLFDGSSQETIGYSWQHVLDKWAKLNFASHLVVIGTYAVFRSL